MREQKAIAADIAGNLRKLADALEEFAASSKEEAPTAKAQETNANAPLPPTLEEVRSKLATLSVAGYGADIRAIIAKFGATKLSDIAPEHYAAVLKEAESIGK